MPVSITAVLRSSTLVTDADSDGMADAGDVIRTTLSFTNSGDTDALNVVVNDLLGGLTETGQINISPIAFNDAFTAVGNTVLRVGGAANIGTGPSSVVAGNLLANDVGSTTVGVGALAADDFTGFTINTVASGTSALGGTFNIFADGSFNYVSQAGDSGVDTFTYTIRDAGFDGIAGNADDLTSTGTVSITLTGQVWYVDAAAAGGGTGTSNSPFNSITALNTAAVDGANDYVYVKGAATGQLVMEQGEHLIGEGAALVVGGFTLATAGARSTLTSSSAGFAVTLAGGGTGNNEIAGINIVSTGGTGNHGLTGTSFGTLTVSNATLDASGQALILSTGAVAGTGFVSTDSDGGTDNVSLVGITGTVVLGTGALSNGTSDVMLVSGGSATITYSGSMTQGTASGYLVRVGGGNTSTLTLSTGTLSATNGLGLNFDNADGTYNFNGTTTLNGGDAGIDIVGGSSGTFTFSTGTSITNPTGDAFDLANSNANVTYSGSISDTTGNAIEIENHDAGTIIFQTGSITSVGASAAGIDVTNNNGGSVTFTNATINLSTAANTAVNLASNTGATIAFTPATGGNGLDIVTTSGTGFNATGGGTVTVTDPADAASNSIVSTTGAAVNMTGTAIGAAGMTFQSISSNGAATGINLNGTGAAGFFTVTGDGSTTLGVLDRDGSGGTIQNTTADGIILTNAHNVTLRQMNLTNNGDLLNAGTAAADATSTVGEHAIEVVGGSNLILSSLLISDPGGDGIFASDLGGINRINGDTLITGVVSGAGHAIYVNNTNASSNLFQLDGVDMTNNSSGFSNVFMTTGNAATLRVDIKNSRFEDLANQAVTLTSSGTGTMTSSVTGNTFQNGKPIVGGVVPGSAAENNLAILSNGGTHTSLVSGNIFDNIAEDGTVANTSVLRTQNSGGVLNVTIDGNTFQNITFIGPVAHGRHIIGHVFEPVAYNAANATNIKIANNISTNINYVESTREAIFIDFRATASGGNVIIDNNNFNHDPGGATSMSQQLFELRFRPTNAHTTNVLIEDNTLVAGAIVSDLIDIDAEDGATVNATIRNNTITANNSTGDFIAVASEDGVAGGLAGTLNASISGNTLNDTDGVRTIDLSEIAGTLNVTQASAAAVTAANPNTTSTTVTGAPAFGAGAPTLPTTPPLPGAAPLSAAFAPPEDVSAANNASTRTGVADSALGAFQALLNGQRMVDSPRFVADAAFEIGGEGASDRSAGEPASTGQHDWQLAVDLVPADDDLAPAGAAAAGGALPPASQLAPAAANAPTGQPVVVDDGVLSQAELDLILDAAIARWAAAGATAAQLAAMRLVQLDVANLSGLRLAESTPGGVTVDDNAAGFSWFIDATPGEDSEFALVDGKLVAPGDTQAGVRIDLLTTVMHELGHQIGLYDDYDSADADTLMAGTINPGVRRLPGEAEAAAATGTPVSSTAYALSPIGLGTVPAGRTVTVQYNATVNAYTNQVIPSFANTATVSGSNFTSVASNVDTLSTTSTLALDSLTLGNLVFNDLNGNGIFDGGDSGVNGVTVTLFNEADTQLGTTVTAGGGLYSFAGLAPGNYIVRIDAANFNGGGALAGFASATGGGADPDNNVDNDDNGVVVGTLGAGGYAISQAITLAHDTEPTPGAGNDTNTTLDFGFANPNDAPVNSLGGTIGTGEDAIDAWLSGMSISDSDAGSNDIDVTFHVDNGTLDIRTDVVGGISIGDIIAGADDSDTITVRASLAEINATLSASNGLTYSPDLNFNGDDTLTVTSNDRGFSGVDPGLTGDATSEEDVDTRTITVSAVDDAPVAQPDAVTTTEIAVLNGGAGALFADNGSGVDSDVDGPALSISAVNGSGVNVGNQITLPSGAKVTVNADGSYSYDPSGQFAYLISAATAAATGAVNDDVPDTFTYTLTGGNTVTVTVNVTGVDGAGDELHGDAGANTITDLTGINQFRVQQGGNDSVFGQGGDDTFYFGGAFTGGDSVDGGADTDRIVLQGNYSGGITLGAASYVAVEELLLLAGNNTTYGDTAGNFYDYTITVPDTALTGGQVMTVNGSALRAGEDLTLNGSGVSNGSFVVTTGAGTNSVSGGALADTFTGGTGFDTLTGNGGADSLSGGDGNDTLNADSLDTTIDGGAGTGDRVVFSASGTTAATWVGIEQLGLQGGANLTLTGTQFTSYLPFDAGIFGTGTVTINIDVADEILFATMMPTDPTVSFVINGSTGSDVIKAAHATNTISGGDGSDQMRGGNLADTIVGGNDRDKLIGWGGADTLTGNAGDDIFRYLLASDSGIGVNADKITDFVSGSDKLDFRFLDSDLVTPGVQPYALTFVGTTAFDGSGNAEIRYGTTGGDLTVELDLDGNGTADMQIVLQGIGGGTLLSGDFLL